jgi:hypothetical protein
MRVLILSAALIVSFWTSPGLADETDQAGPYDRAIRQHRAGDVDVVVYTNELLKEMFGGDEGRDTMPFFGLAEDDGESSPPPSASLPVTRRSVGGDVKVYTNEDLEKMFGIVEEADRDDGSPPESIASRDTSTTAQPDPLTWMRQNQAAQRDQRMAREKAQERLAQARAELAGLEKQLLAARNPFSARPVLSEDERKLRSTSGESAADRYKRTEQLVEAARQAVKDAEAEVARLRSQRP